MYYGGGLLSHLSLQREDSLGDPKIPQPEDLIALLRINQRSVIVIDSDKNSEADVMGVALFEHYITYCHLVTYVKR